VSRQNSGSPAAPVTVMIARWVTDGREEDFQVWAAALTREAESFPGFLGAGLLHPGHLGQPWHVVYRFDTHAHLDEWEQSSERSAVLSEGAHLVADTAVHRVSGLETWFSLPGPVREPPPGWKMFLVSGACIFVLQYAIYSLLGRAVLRWPLSLRLLLVVSAVTACMTWLVMPTVARLAASWLYRSRTDHNPSRTDRTR
jgi:antibiotic biosynthesis monooxygenase (ABM) superfamily enzyme